MFTVPVRFRVWLIAAPLAVIVPLPPVLMFALMVPAPLMVPVLAMPLVSARVAPVVKLIAAEFSDGSRPRAGAGEVNLCAAPELVMPLVIVQGACRNVDDTVIGYGSCSAGDRDAARSECDGRAGVVQEPCVCATAVPSVSVNVPEKVSVAPLLRQRADRSVSGATEWVGWRRW